jgi:hypothetical protein
METKATRGYHRRAGGRVGGSCLRAYFPGTVPAPRAALAIQYPIQADTAEVTRWFLLPRGKEYRSFRVIRWERGKPEKIEPVKIVNEYLANDSTILAFKLLSVKGGYTHEVTWFYK